MQIRQNKQHNNSSYRNSPVTDKNKKTGFAIDALSNGLQCLEKVQVEQNHEPDKHPPENSIPHWAKLMQFILKPVNRKSFIDDENLFLWQRAAADTGIMIFFTLEQAP
jgi:hypothetical protein